MCNYWEILNYLIYSTFIGLLLFSFAIYLIIINKRKRVLQRLKKTDSLNYKREILNISKSISKSKNLYKQLIVKVHPDKFTGDDNEAATILSQKITSSKRNYNELILLSKEVESFLNSRTLR